MGTKAKEIQLDQVIWRLNSGQKPRITIARLDLLHPVVSGNKSFKLFYNLQQAIQEQKSGIITMGGCFSNHLVATAYACKESGMKSIGLIRGELPNPLNHSLRFCTENGMQLIPIDRTHFHRTGEQVLEKIRIHPDLYFVPEGGDNAYGEKGCTEIMHRIKGADQFTHIVCAIGTGTTFRGLLQSLKKHQTGIGIPVLKIPIEEQDGFLREHVNTKSNASFQVFFNYALNGYAKKDTTLLNFMNLFYKETNVPTDFVYTGKVMHAVTHLLETNRFPENSNILVLHTGGLQGNDSLPRGALCY
jgi:1-aminocyclopropane-1-carboxylate deaminase/D-cysteine desulfhydrase-like pyridoxal-dependent ACC family enzyme